MPETVAITIAIDGPSGSGKSSVSRAVASALGLSYLDTGAMFRALTWWCEQHQVDIHDHSAVASAVREMPLRMHTDPLDPAVEIDGTRVEGPLRTAAISARVSAVATNPAVRQVLADQQRLIISDARAHGRGIVVEGRDITTVIAPQAEHRILLSASEEARLHRRASELQAAGQAQQAGAVRDQVLRRDRDDSTVSAFSAPAAGVHGIDTSSLTFQEAVAAVIAVTDHPRPDPHITNG